MSLTLLLGGARSGKSTVALQRARARGGPFVFVATAEARDEEMRSRIARHRAERDSSWSTVEAPLELESSLAAAPPHASVVVDCLTLWVSNLLEDGTDDETALRTASAAARQAAARPGLTLAVSNEVGMGVVPAHPLGRRYRDLLGSVNVVWAQESAEALLVVAGRTLALDGCDVP